MRLRGPVALFLSLFTLTGCFESDERIYTAEDLWKDIPDTYVRSIRTSRFFDDPELKAAYAGGGTFSVTANAAVCPFGIARPESVSGDGEINIAVFNLEPDCHFGMARSPWLAYAARIYPAGDDRQDVGMSFGIPGDKSSILAFAQTKDVTLEHYRMDGEDRYKATAETVAFKAFLSAYMQSALIEYPD